MNISFNFSMWDKYTVAPCLNPTIKLLKPIEDKVFLATVEILTQKLMCKSLETTGTGTTTPITKDSSK